PTCLPPRSTLFPYTTLFRSFDSNPCSPCRTIAVWNAPWGCNTWRPLNVPPIHLPGPFPVALTLFQKICALLWSPDRCPAMRPQRSEEHTSELQSRENLVCRL